MRPPSSATAVVFFLTAFAWSRGAAAVPVEAPPRPAHALSHREKVRQSVQAKHAREEQERRQRAADGDVDAIDEVFGLPKHQGKEGVGNIVNELNAIHYAHEHKPERHYSQEAPHGDDLDFEAPKDSRGDDLDFEDEPPPAIVASSPPSVNLARKTPTRAAQQTTDRLPSPEETVMRTAVASAARPPLRASPSSSGDVPPPWAIMDGEAAAAAPRPVNLGRVSAAAQDPDAPRSRRERLDDPQWVADRGMPEPLEAKPWVFRGLATYPAPEQGYHGELVSHRNMETMTKDFDREFGPNGPASACDVCKEQFRQHAAEGHHISWWCERHARDVCVGGEGADAVNFAAAGATGGGWRGAHSAAPTPSLHAFALAIPVWLAATRGFRT